MKIYNYSDFLLEQEMKNWEKLNEEAYWEDLTEKIFARLDNAFKMGESIFLSVVIKMFRFFKANPKVLAIIVGLLIAKYQFSKDKLIDVMPDDTIVTAEELYAKEMEGKGLPEDWDTDNQDSKTVKYNRPVSGNIKKFMKALADKESTNTPDTINSLGYMGKYQFGEIALKDILQKEPGESDEEYEMRIKSYWPSNFGKIKTNKDYKYFQTKFRNKGERFWPEYKQDAAMKQLLANNTKYLGDYIDKWAGKTKKGVKLTKSGLLAGAHLLGPSNVKRFLDNGVITKDANGTPITEYIKKFGGYAINL